MLPFLLFLKNVNGSIAGHAHSTRYESKHQRVTFYRQIFIQGPWNLLNISRINWHVKGQEFTLVGRKQATMSSNYIYSPVIRLHIQLIEGTLRIAVICRRAFKLRVPLREIMAMQMPLFYWLQKIRWYDALTTLSKENPTVNLHRKWMTWRTIINYFYAATQRKNCPFINWRVSNEELSSRQVPSGVVKIVQVFLWSNDLKMTWEKQFCQWNYPQLINRHFSNRIAPKPKYLLPTTAVNFTSWHC